MFLPCKDYLMILYIFYVLLLYRRNESPFISQSRFLTNQTSMNINRKDKDREWLVKKLNELKDAEYGEEQAYPITIEQIYTYCNPSNLEVRRYRTFYIPKKNGQKREISAPYRTLNDILHFLNLLLTEIYEPNNSAMGLEKNRSIVDNARIHVGQNYVFNMDLENFFPSISEARVITRLQYPPFNFNKKLAFAIGGLCAIRKEVNGEVTFVLPQGAPTSPLLSNAVCDFFDKQMRRLAKKHGLHYSRYADDITFSSMRNVFQEDGEFMGEVQRIISKQGFKINKAKTRLQKKNHRQEVTGLTVNGKPNVAHQYIHDLRCILHIWEKYGYADAYSRFYPKYKADKGHVKKGEPILENVIEGKLNYLRMVKGEEDAVYKKLMERYSNLLTHLFYDKETDKNGSYIYVESYKILDFEKKFDTKIELRISEKDKIIGYCILSSKEMFMSVSKKTQDWLRIDGKAIVADGITTLDNPFLASCYITLCRKKGKNFWLLTKDLHKVNAPVKLGNMDLPIDELINIWRTGGLDEASMYFDLLAKKKIKELPKESQKKKEIDITYITQERIQRAFKRLKKMGFTDQKAQNLLNDAYAKELFKHLLREENEEENSSKTALTFEQIDWAVNQMISNGWSEQEARSIIYKEYSWDLLSQLILDNMDKFENDEDFLSPTLIEIVTSHLKSKGWPNDKTQLIIDYLKQEVSKIA